MKIRKILIGLAIVLLASTLLLAYASSTAKILISNTGTKAIHLIA